MAEGKTRSRILTNNPKFISETPELSLTEDDFESGQDSTILARERSRGSKLEGSYRKKKGVLLEKSNHTATFLPAGRSARTIISKRDLGSSGEQQPCCSKWTQILTRESEATNLIGMTVDIELPQLAEPAKQTANQKEASEIAKPKVANKTKTAERQQPAKQKVTQRQSKNKQAKSRNRKERGEKATNTMETTESDHEDEHEQARNADVEGQGCLILYCNVLI